MPKCALCKQAEANKKNSHILPHFLIKTATNKGARTERDFELTFAIGADEFIDTYFGRNITLDTIMEYKGRELTDEELKKHNPFARDFLFCQACEKYFDKLESYFATEVHQRLLKKNYGTQKVDKKGNTISINDKVDIRLLFLFIYSIFFRCSVADFHGFKLKSLERKFRKLLLKYCDPEMKGILANLNVRGGEFKYYPIITTFFENSADGDPTKNFVALQHTDKPYFIYLNEVTFQLFREESHIGKSKEFLFGINELISPREGVSRKKGGFKVTIFTPAQLKKVLDIVYQSMSDKQIAFFEKAFIQAHWVVFGVAPGKKLVDFFVQTLVSRDVPAGERYSINSFANAMYYVCKVAYQIPT